MVLSHPARAIMASNTAVSDEFDGIGDYFTAHERGLIPRAHVSPSLMAIVLNSSGVPPRGFLLLLFPQACAVRIARHRFDPGIGNADERFGECHRP
jgi:hypothetical protein